MVDDIGNSSDEDLILEVTTPLTKVRRRALWGVLAVVAVVTGAVVVASGGDGGPPRLPVALGSSAGREAAGAAMSADMSIAWVTYVAGEGLPALGGEAPAYRLDGAVDENRVRALAEALGVTGDPTHDGGLWHLESDGAVLEVYEDGGGAWWYSANQGVAISGGGSSSSGSGSAGCDPAATECAFAETGTAVPVTTTPDEVCANDGSGCATEPAPAECPPDAKCVEPSPPVGDPCPPDAICTVPIECLPDTTCTVPEPIEPTPPADLPSEDEGRQIALDLLAATGMDLDDAKVTVDGPYDAWYVSVEPRLDGVPVSGWLASVGVGSKGAITSASGTLATPEPLGDYPLIDTRAAIDRLNALQGGFGGGPVPMGAPDGIARDTGVATADAPMPSEPCRSDDPSCSGLVDPGEPTTTIVSQCKVQPDGSEICESFGGSTGVDCVVLSVPAGAPTPVCPDNVECLGAPAVEPGADPADQAVGGCPDPGVCYEAVPPVGREGGMETTPASPDATYLPSPECPEPIPYPEPEPIEITLTDAERVLTMLPAFDGSGDAYLLPGYRFSNADGAIVDVPAVADESLAPTTIPETTETTEAPAPPPTGCETVVEGDGSATTHPIEKCPQPTEPIVLEPGQTPEPGVGYYVDVDVECAAFTLGDQTWTLEKGDLAGWSTPHEGGTFTLDAPDHGTFVGDAGGEKTATFVTGSDPDGCQPAPRS